MSTETKNWSTQSDATASRMTQQDQIVSRQHNSREPNRMKCCHYSDKDVIKAQKTWLRYQTRIGAMRNRCYSLVADLRGPVAGWQASAAPHPTMYIVSIVVTIAIDRCQWCIILGADSKEAP